jgi:hypothetical protein
MARKVAVTVAVALVVVQYPPHMRAISASDAAGAHSALSADNAEWAIGDETGQY